MQILVVVNNQVYLYLHTLSITQFQISDCVYFNELNKVLTKTDIKIIAYHLKVS